VIMEEADKASAHRTSVRFSRSNGQNRCMAATTLPSVTGMGHYAVRCDIPICFHLKDSMALAKSAARHESAITPRDIPFSNAKNDPESRGLGYRIFLRCSSDDGSPLIEVADF